MEDKLTKRLLDGLRNELANVAADMAGINPRLELHGRLAAKCAELQAKIAEQTGKTERPMSMRALKAMNRPTTKK